MDFILSKEQVSLRELTRDFGANTATNVTDAARVCGGYGFIEEYLEGKLMGAAKIMQLREGTPRIQRPVTARETFPRRVDEPAVVA